MDLAPPPRAEPTSAQAQAGARTRFWRRLVACAGLVATFIVFGIAVDFHWLAGADRAVMTWMAQHRTSPIELAAGAIVTLATPQLLILVTLAVGAWQVGARRSRGIAVHVTLRVGLLVGSVVVLKNLFARPGPPVHAPFRYTPLDALAQMTQVGDGGAFPSGHTTTTVVCVAVLLGLTRVGSRVRRLVLVVSVAVVSIALVYMGFHWFTDVVGAWLLGAAILAVPVPTLLPRNADFW